MALLNEYYVPGLHVSEYAIDVPLDWDGHEPGMGFDGETIRLFYRVVCAPEHVNDRLPLLVFLQGGPGGAAARSRPTPMAGLPRPSSISVWCCPINAAPGVPRISTHTPWRIWTDGRLRSI